MLTSSEADALKMGVTSSSMFCVRSQAIREDQEEEEERNTIFFVRYLFVANDDAGANLESHFISVNKTYMANEIISIKMHTK